MLPDTQAWIKDAQRRYLWVNRAFLLNYGLNSLSEVLERTDEDLSPGHLAAQYRFSDERVLAGEKIRRRLELVGRFDHTARWCLTTKLPVLNASGRIIGTAGITHPAPGTPEQSDEPDSTLARVLSHMREHFSEALDNGALARLAGRSVRAFERLFARQMHLTPQQYLRRVRVRLACHPLVHSRRSLGDIAHAHGFCDQSHFTREFRRETGMTPGEYRLRFSD